MARCQLSRSAVTFFRSRSTTRTAPTGVLVRRSGRVPGKRTCLSKTFGQSSAKGGCDEWSGVWSRAAKRASKQYVGGSYSEARVYEYAVEAEGQITLKPQMGVGHHRQNRSIRLGRSVIASACELTLIASCSASYSFMFVVNGRISRGERKGSGGPPGLRSSRRHVTPACWLRSLTSVVEADLWRDRMRNLAATPFLSCFALMGMQPCMCCEILF